MTWDMGHAPCVSSSLPVAHFTFSFGLHFVKRGLGRVLWPVVSLGYGMMGSAGLVCPQTSLTLLYPTPKIRTPALLGKFGKFLSMEIVPVYKRYLWGKGWGS